ncbi:MAG TPA: DUF58 domain-containing protein [Micromonosporaceae bacterium]
MSEPEQRWVPTRALGRAVLVSGLLIVIAVLLGRADLVVLAAPFVLGTAVSLLRRPADPPRVRIGVERSSLAEGDEVSSAVDVASPDRAGYDLVVLRARVASWLALRHADRPYAVAVPPGSDARVPLVGPALRWGRHPIGPASATAFASDALLVSAPVTGSAVKITVYPRTEPFDADDAMPRAAGLVGAHRSRRLGEDGELAGVRVFAPGDRLRRVDWRVSLRERQLHVAATFSDRDAEVVLLVDVLYEAGRSGGVHGEPSVLDTTVRAAAGIAEHYLDRGDRVALLEYGLRARRLRPATGRRQYLAVLEWLLDCAPTVGAGEPSPYVFGPHLLSGNALVVVLSPLLEPRSAAMVANLARAGRFVVAVDTLPPGIRLPGWGHWGAVPARLWRLERDNVLGQLREHGVPVVAWAGAGSLDAVLRDVARMASGPKAVPR